ncbi:MAG: kelch repeat-containing protein [bacterium]
MRKKIGGIELYARRIIFVALLGLILIFTLGKLVMAQVCERIVPYVSPPINYPPEKRDGHALISSMGGNEQFLFGGFGQNTNLWILRYEGDNWRWEYRVAQGTAPTTRGGHSGIFVPGMGAQDYIIVFGGSQSFLGVVTDSTTYKLEDPWNWGSTWEILTTTGTVPSARAEHTAVYDFNTNKMVVFGGYTGGSPVSASAETYFLDFGVDLSTWTEVYPSNSPPARYGHTAVWGAGNTMVFGGKDDSGDLLNDCWKLQFSPANWEEINVTGDKPPARWQHSAVWIDPLPEEPGGMLIFGGEDENRKYLDDFWILRQPGPMDPPNVWRWERIDPIGDLPSGRRGHAAGTGWGLKGERTMYIFGGFDGNDNLNDIYAFFKGGEIEESLEKKPFNAPNPFDPDRQDTKICYYLDEDDDDVKIKLFTLTGELVYSWENISGRKGMNDESWDGRNEKGRIVENGGYICLIEAGGKKQKCKIAVLR